MPDHVKLLSNLDQADVQVRKAEECLTPLPRIKQVDAYILGLLRSIRMLLEEAKKITKSAKRSADQSPTSPKKQSTTIS